LGEGTHCVGAGCCQVGLCLAVKCYSACCSLHDSKDFAVDSLSIISSSSWFVEVLSTCTTFGVCFIGGVVVVSFVCHWSVFGCCWGFVLQWHHVGRFLGCLCLFSGSFGLCFFCSCGVAHVGGHPGAEVSHWSVLLENRPLLASSWLPLLLWGLAVGRTLFPIVKFSTSFSIVDS